MKRFGLFFLILFCAISVFTQKTKIVSKTKKKTASVSNYQSELESAIAKSMRAPSLRITSDMTVEGNKVFSRFEYASPDRYQLFETLDGKVYREAIEIARQRYQKKGDRWIKTSKDYFPLRDQHDLNFPLKLSSKPTDSVKVKSAEVLRAGEESVDGKKCRKFSYAVTYQDLPSLDSAGYAWIAIDNGFLVRLETHERDLSGRVMAVWNYFYDQEIKIEQPADFIEPDRVD